jgi:hypothetical protein
MREGKNKLEWLKASTSKGLVYGLGVKRRWRRRLRLCVQHHDGRCQLVGHVENEVLAGGLKLQIHAAAGVILNLASALNAVQENQISLVAP